MATYDQKVEQMKADFAKKLENPKDVAWVEAKLQFMFDIDQFMRSYMSIPSKHGYTEEERAYYIKEFSPRFEAVDQSDTSDMKKLLALYDWIRISMFGEKADSQAWLIVQHADKDIEFQKNVLVILEQLYPIGETLPANYAYLYDRVASSWADPSQRKLQRYGTQGSCLGPGKWEPIPIEDPAHLDERRASMGMPPMAEYKKLVEEYCL